MLVLGHTPTPALSLSLSLYKSFKIHEQWKKARLRRHRIDNPFSSPSLPSLYFLQKQKGLPKVLCKMEAQAGDQSATPRPFPSLSFVVENSPIPITPCLTPTVEGYLLNRPSIFNEPKILSLSSGGSMPKPRERRAVEKVGASSIHGPTNCSSRFHGHHTILHGGAS